MRAQLSVTGRTSSQNCPPSLSRYPLRKTFQLALSWVLGSDHSDRTHQKKKRERSGNVRERSHGEPRWLLPLLPESHPLTSASASASPTVVPRMANMPSEPEGITADLFQALLPQFPEFHLPFTSSHLCLQEAGRKPHLLPMQPCAHSSHSAPSGLNLSMALACPTASGSPQRTRPALL